MFLTSSWQRFFSSHGDANREKEHLQFMPSSECRSLAASGQGCHRLFMRLPPSGETKNGSVAAPEPPAEPLHCQANGTNGIILVEQAYLRSLYLVDRVV